MEKKASQDHSILLNPYLLLGPGLARHFAVCVPIHKGSCLTFLALKPQGFDTRKHHCFSGSIGKEDRAPKFMTFDMSLWVYSQWLDPPFPFLRVRSKFVVPFSCWNLPFSSLNSQHLTHRSSTRISPSGWSGRWTPAERWRHGGIVVMARVPSIKPQITRSKSTIKMAAWIHRI